MDHQIQIERNTTRSRTRVESRNHYNTSTKPYAQCGVSGTITDLQTVYKSGFLSLSALLILLWQALLQVVSRFGKESYYFTSSDLHLMGPTCWWLRLGYTVFRIWIRCLFAPGSRIRDGWKIKIGIRDEHFGSYFREHRFIWLKNLNALMQMRIRESFWPWIRDPGWKNLDPG